jgi:hypothetical protein
LELGFVVPTSLHPILVVPSDAVYLRALSPSNSCIVIGPIEIKGVGSFGSSTVRTRPTATPPGLTELSWNVALATGEQHAGLPLESVKVPDPLAEIVKPKSLSTCHIPTKSPGRVIALAVVVVVDLAIVVVDD